MLPTQYITNTIALTVLLLVKPETLDVIRLRHIGMLMAYVAAKTTPVICPAWDLRLYTRTMPTMPTTQLKIIIRTRACGSTEARLEVMRRKTISFPPVGIWSKIEVRVLKPKPFTIRGWN